MKEYNSANRAIAERASSVCGREFLDSGKLFRATIKIAHADAAR